MAIAKIRVKTLGHGVDPIKTSDFLKDNEKKKDAQIELTNIDPGKEVTDLTDKFGDYLSHLGSNIKEVIKNTLNYIKSKLSWIKEGGSGLLDWLHNTIGKFLGISMGFMGDALNLKGKTLREIIQECGIFSAGLKIKFGINTITFWLYSLLAILLQLLCMGIKGVFKALMGFAEALGLPESAFGSTLSYFMNNKGKSNGIDNIIDVGESDIAVNAHKYVNNPNKTFLDHMKGDFSITKDPVTKFGRVKSSLDVLAPKWSGSNTTSLGGDNELKFDGTYMVKNDGLLDLAHKYNLNEISKPKTEDEEYENSLVFTKNMALMKIVN